jgi:hypothetical protein
MEDEELYDILSVFDENCPDLSPELNMLPATRLASQLDAMCPDSRIWEISDGADIDPHRALRLARAVMTMEIEERAAIFAAATRALHF